MFLSLKRWFIEKLGGYSTIDSAIDAIKEKPGPERTRILTLAVKRLFNTIGSEDILQVREDGSWMLEGKPISKAVKDLLIAESTQLLDMTLWKVLQSDMKYQANKKMYLLAQDNEQLTAGKLWVYTFDTLKTRLNSMKSGSAEFNAKK